MKILITLAFTLAAGLLAAIPVARGADSATTGAKAGTHFAVHLPAAADFATLVLKSEKPVLVDFYADWCPPCRRLAPELEALAKARQNSLAVVKVNVDKFPALAARYKVEGIPALFLIRDGTAIAGTSGYQGRKQLEQWLDAALKAKPKN
ncbi:MAG: thioredoxin [Lentisphaeria bacterium]